MRRYTLILFSALLLPLFAQAQVPSPTFKQEVVGKGYDAFIPENWNIIMADSADFNDDRIEDYVFILQADNDYLNGLHFNTKLNAPPRILLVLFGKLNDTLDFATKSDSVILRADGGEGDPLTQGTGMKTDGMVLEINYAGGLSVQWTGQYKFSYKNKDKEWVLTYYKGTEYNTNDEDAPIKTVEVDFNKKFIKHDKVKTPNASLPKIQMEKFKPRTITIEPGLVL
jgi:hypothetical protein